MGDGGHVGQHRGRHIEGVAPPPEELLRIVGTDDEAVEHCPGAFEMRRNLVLGVEVEVGLADGHVVGVREAALFHLPVVLVGQLDDGVLVHGIAGGLRGREEAVVVSREGPLAVEVSLGVRDGPVADLLHGFADGGVGEGRREIGGERAGIGG